MRDLHDFEADEYHADLVRQSSAEAARVAALEADARTLRALRNWKQDEPLDNGNYYCRCVECGAQFVGYKRRIQCRLCATEYNARTLRELREALAGVELIHLSNRNIHNRGIECTATVGMRTETFVRQPDPITALIAAARKAKETP